MPPVSRRSQQMLSKALAAESSKHKKFDEKEFEEAIDEVEKLMEVEASMNKKEANINDLKVAKKTKSKKAIPITNLNSMLLEVNAST